MREAVGHTWNPRQPWGWPTVWQRVSWVFAIVVGVILMAPWWLSAWDACTEARQLAQELARTQSDLKNAQQQREQSEQALAQRVLETSSLAHSVSADLPSFTQALTHLAERESLSLSVVDWSAGLPVTELKKGSLQQVPVHVQLQGTWSAWMRWWSKLPEVVPLATLSRLDLHAQPRGGWRAHVELRIPQRLPSPLSPHGASDWQLASTSSSASQELMHADPVDARAWQHTQSQHAQQHPSYARWIVPELQRTRSALEELPREHLRFVGQISQTGIQQALLRSAQAKGSASHAPVYRVSVGDYVGQDYGRVQSIAADQLTLRELVRDANGIWQPRDVTLPLEDGAK